MRLALVTRANEFYDLFARAGVNALAAARLAEIRFREHPSASVPQEVMKELEHEGDRLTRRTIELLNTRYVTPFDREDIYQLATAIDDVVDTIEEATDLLGLYRVETSMPQAIGQCTILVASAESVASALADLRGMRAATRHIVEVKRLENEGDRVIRDALAALFDDEELDARTIIRWKDIFEALEQAIDGCATVAAVIGNIVVKNA